MYISSSFIEFLHGCTVRLGRVAIVGVGWSRNVTMWPCELPPIVVLHVCTPDTDNFTRSREVIMTLRLSNTGLETHQARYSTPYIHHLYAGSVTNPHIKI